MLCLAVFLPIIAGLAMLIYPPKTKAYREWAVECVTLFTSFIVLLCLAALSMLAVFDGCIILLSGARVIRICSMLMPWGIAQGIVCVVLLAHMLQVFSAAEQRKEKLFNKFKNECITKVNEMIKEDSNNVELESLKKQLEEQKFNKDSIVQDIAKLLEIRDILLDK